MNNQLISIDLMCDAGEIYQAVGHFITVDKGTDFHVNMKTNMTSTIEDLKINLFNIAEMQTRIHANMEK